MRVVAVSLSIALLASDAAASGAIRGTVWPGLAAARRAERLRAAAPAAPSDTRRGWFDFLLHPLSGPEDAPATEPAPVRDAKISDVVVTVREIPAATERHLAHEAGRATSTSPLIVITGGRFLPRVTVVPAGSLVRLVNDDAAWHRAFSVSAAARFDLDRLRPGDVRTAWLGHAGVVTVHCDFHPDEIGFVRVAPNHAIARPDSLGRFRLPDLPPGTYDVEVWHPWRGAHVRRVVVPKRGDAICDLAF